MLSLETCKALAEKYSEVREHRLSQGEMLYSANGVAFLVLPNAEPYGMTKIGTWIPALTDLLEIATRLVASGHPPYARLEYDPSAETWYFGPAQYGSIDNAAEGKSPEDAVAAWLLARSVSA